MWGHIITYWTHTLNSQTLALTQHICAQKWSLKPRTCYISFYGNMKLYASPNSTSSWCPGQMQGHLCKCRPWCPLVNNNSLTCSRCWMPHLPSSAPRHQLHFSCPEQRVLMWPVILALPALVEVLITYTQAGQVLSDLIYSLIWLKR